MDHHKIEITQFSSIPVVRLPHNLFRTRIIFSKCLHMRQINRVCHFLILHFSFSLHILSPFPHFLPISFRSDLRTLTVCASLQCEWAQCCQWVPSNVQNVFKHLLILPIRVRPVTQCKAGARGCPLTIIITTNAKLHLTIIYNTTYHHCHTHNSP